MILWPFDRRNNVRQLLIIRHGDYNGLDRLSPTGARQITDLSEKIAREVDGGSLLILSSSAPRASDSAKIIAERLRVPFEEHDVLWSGATGKVRGYDEDYARALEMILSHSNQADTVILVTHLEYTEDFPHFFGRKCLGVAFPMVEINKGTAYLIDCVGKTIVHISHAS